MTWILLTYKVPPEPAARRVALWRKLKSMGAVYLQNGVCLLPETREHMRQLKMLENDAAEMGITANSRLVSVEKSREDREGLRMIFTLLPDYTYSITPAPDNADEVRVDTPGNHTLDILRLMRKENTPWCVKDLVEHDTVGGLHRKRAIIYSLNKLEDQKLIEEVDVPKSKSKGGGG